MRFGLILVLTLLAFTPESRSSAAPDSTEVLVQGLTKDGSRKYALELAGDIKSGKYKVELKKDQLYRDLDQNGKRLLFMDFVFSMVKKNEIALHSDFLDLECRQEIFYSSLDFSTHIVKNLTPDEIDLLRTYDLAEIFYYGVPGKKKVTMGFIKKICSMAMSHWGDLIGTAANPACEKLNKDFGVSNETTEIVIMAINQNMEKFIKDCDERIKNEKTPQKK